MLGKKPKVKKEVKNKTWDIFTYIYYSPKHERFSNEIMTKFSLSKQALYYHTKWLTDNDFVKKIGGRPNLYKALKSPLEIDPVKEFFVGDERPPYIRTHAMGFKAEILREGHPLKLQNRTQMTNWPLSWGKVAGLSVKKTNKSLIIWAKEIRGQDARENERKAFAMVYPVFQKLIERYDLEITMPKLMQKPHHAIVSETHKNLAQQVLSNVGTISNEEGFIDDSEGTGGEVEVTTAEHANAILNSGKEIIELKKLIQGSVATQNAMANIQLLMASNLKQIGKAIDLLRKGQSKFIKFISQRRLGEFS